jgi:mono/diheme cytochrome c family protein
MGALRLCSPRSRRRLVAALASAVVLAALSHTDAFAAGSAEAGKDLAERWCASCHQIAPDAAASDVAPSFPTLVREKDGDFSWARAWLFDPHPPMTGIRLSNREIDDIVAYLKSLPREVRPQPKPQ